MSVVVAVVVVVVVVLKVAAVVVILGLSTGLPGPRETMSIAAKTWQLPGPGVKIVSGREPTQKHSGLQGCEKCLVGMH